jgi:hypothetical protein
MKSFKLAGDYVAVCEWQKTRQAFRHVAVLLHKGQEVGRAKCCYQNRTWERFPYESVVRELIGKYFKDGDELAHYDALEKGGC